ncbi:ankyrin repeat domain-containing protein [Helicobacter sp. 11S02629-2]|uniref:ankyrin repeat domain-containing protein n=1 Tax=Helicobacter sp. 11S02629-2 TaxID=1476195 RepID=UPI000BA76F01|nr:ankyrin repeat domain-containing protein [Helicobacter sp. 11S02629-2]PAF44632.1 hypothetical protein BKH40_05230 [Helicobacter sp. 11S02629-2]
MFKLAFLLSTLFVFLNANVYDYLLTSNVYSDVKKGIELGADVNGRIRGKTPLYIAVQNNNIEILYLLLKRGAKVNALSDGESPLHKAVELRKLLYAKALLESGANPNLKDNIKGNTPLAYAVVNNDVNMVSLLLRYGADMKLSNDEGISPAKFILANTFIPPLEAQDQVLAFSSSAFRVGSGAIALSIRNLSDYPVVVNYVSFYINKTLVNDLPLNRVIPPNSVIDSMAILPLPPKSLDLLKIDEDGITDIEYGFDVKYTIGNSPNSLYNTTIKELKLW